MICYRDRTFCEASECLAFPFCDRAFTEKVKRDVERVGLPISYYLEPAKLECYRKPDEPKKP